MTPPLSLPSLPKKHAHLCLRVARFMEEELGLTLQNAHFLLAFSGGADSTALACILLALAPYKHFSFSAAHLDHSLRPESPQDALFSENFCKKHHIPFYSNVLPVAEIAAKQQTGLEETARTLRYQFLEETRQKCGAHSILLAHHTGDLAEDILMRLTRGTSWPTLGGMPALDPARHIARPLLMEDRESLLSLLQHLGQPWQEDSSNTNTAYTRNRIRHVILPLLLQENPAFFDVVRQLWKTARLDKTAFNQRLLAHPQLQSSPTPNSIILHSPSLLLLPPADRLRLYTQTIHQLHGHPRSHTLFKLDTAFVNKKSGSVFQFPGVDVNVEQVCIRFTVKT